MIEITEIEKTEIMYFDSVKFAEVSAKLLLLCLKNFSNSADSAETDERKEKQMSACEKLQKVKEQHLNLNKFD